MAEFQRLGRVDAVTYEGAKEKDDTILQVK
jgi:hypothetical protein